MAGSRLTRRAALALLPALAATGCRRQGSARRPLAFWAMSYEGDYAPLLMPDFTARTGIAVEVQSLPWTAAHEKLLTAFAGGSLPDVMMLPNGWVGEFAMVGAIAALRDPALVADVAPAVLATVRHAGADHAVPWTMGPQAQFYRTDLVQQAGYDAPPTDWAGWRAMGRQIKRRRPDSFAFLLLLNWWDALFTFFGQTTSGEAGGLLLLRERDTRGNFATAEAREALAFYVSLFDEGLAPRVQSTAIDDPVAAFAQGYFAVYPSGPTLLVDLHRRSAEIPPERWATQRMPGPHGPAAASSVNASLAIAATTRRPAQARALVAHLISAASELRLQHLIGNLPAARSAWTDPALATRLLRPFAEQMQVTDNGPRIVEWERIRMEVQLIAERVVRGGLGIDQGLAEMDRRADHILAQRRALVQSGRLA